MSPLSTSTVFLPVQRIDLESTLDGGQAFQWRRIDNGTYRGIVLGRPWRLSEVDGGITAEALDGGEAVSAGLALAHYLALDDDLLALGKRFMEDPCLGPATAGYPGLRVLRQDPWECLAAFICSSTSSVPRIKKDVAAVARAYGPRAGDGEFDYVFPGPDRLASAGEASLRRLGLGFRAEYLDKAARSLADGRLDLHCLKAMPYLEAREGLMELRGVGEKVADCVLALSLGQREAFPVDRWVRRALERWYNVPPGLNNARAGEWARAHFGEFASYANQYMFHRQRLMSRGRSSVSETPFLST